MLRLPRFASRNTVETLNWMSTKDALKVAKRVTASTHTLLIPILEREGIVAGSKKNPEENLNTVMKMVLSIVKKLPKKVALSRAQLVTKLS